MPDIKKPNYIYIFFKYIFDHTIKAIIELPGEIWYYIRYLIHKYTYPNAWFYTVFIIYLYRLLVIKNRDQSDDILLIIIMILLILWQELDRGTFIYEYREKERSRLLEEAKKRYPPEQQHTENKGELNAGRK